MVAPINATATFDAAGETFTLRLNFATLDAARKAGVNVFKDDLGDLLNMAPVLAAFAKPEHPAMDEEQAFALLARHGEAVGGAMAELFEEFGESAEGNARPKPKGKKT